MGLRESSLFGNTVEMGSVVEVEERRFEPFTAYLALEFSFHERVTLGG